MSGPPGGLGHDKPPHPTPPYTNPQPGLPECDTYRQFGTGASSAPAAGSKGLNIAIGRK